MNPSENVILRAQFSPKAKKYYVISSCIPWVASIVGILFLPIWIPIANVMAGRWFRSLECVLTDRALRFKKGVVFRVEKTIPLDKITDLGSTQGPIMRALEIENVTIETAGSTAPGALLSLAGLEDPDVFREAGLSQKEKVELTDSSAPAAATSLGQDAALMNDEAITLLREIRDSLRNLEKR